MSVTVTFDTQLFLKLRLVEFAVLQCTRSLNAHSVQKVPDGVTRKWH